MFDNRRDRNRSRSSVWRPPQLFVGADGSSVTSREGRLIELRIPQAG